MSSTGYLEIYIDQGESFSIDIILDNDSGDFSLDQYSIKGDIKKSYNSSNTFMSFSTSKQSVTNPAIINISLSAEDTEKFSFGRYVYDVFITNTESQKRTKILGGILYIESSATKI